MLIGGNDDKDSDRGFIKAIFHINPDDSAFKVLMIWRRILWMEVGERRSTVRLT